MARFIEKKGKIVKSVSEAASYARKREEFSGTLVQMMDGGRGRRYAGRWNVKYEDGLVGPDGPVPAVKTYTVYSYGDHWPMYTWDDSAQCWYGNGTKCWSRTTSKHTNQLRPGKVQQYVPLETLQQIAERGAAGWVTDKLEGSNDAEK